MTDKTEIDEETVTEQDNNEKTLTQSEVNKLLAKERREAKEKFEKLHSEYAEFKSAVEAKQAAEDAKNKSKVDALKKDLPESITQLLDKLSITEQLEFLEKEAEGLKVDKRTIPITPQSRENDSKQEKTLPIRF